MRRLTGNYYYFFFNLNIAHIKLAGADRVHNMKVQEIYDSDGTQQSFDISEYNAYTAIYFKKTLVPVANESIPLASLPSAAVTVITIHGTAHWMLKLVPSFQDHSCAVRKWCFRHEHSCFPSG